MSDPMNTSGAAAFWGNYSSTATKSVQTFATEIQRAAKESYESTMALMEQLRGAKTMEEVVSVQTSFMQKAFANYADTTRRMSELMMAAPMEMAKQGQAAFQQGANTVTQATEQAGEQIKKAGEEFNQSHG